MLLFFLNLSLNKFGSGKTKSVPHSPVLPYIHSWHVAVMLLNYMVVSNLIHDFFFSKMLRCIGESPGCVILEDKTQTLVNECPLSLTLQLS
jgi:hypothetical protein